MGRFDHAIERYVTDPADRLWAHNFLARCENHPYADSIAAMLPDIVALNAMVTAGEITQQQAWDRARSFASEGYGLQPHVIAEATAVADGMRVPGGDDAETQGVKSAGEQRTRCCRTNTEARDPRRDDRLW
jgi:hypothetical protein